MSTLAETYLVFWDINGNPEVLEDLLKIKADVRVCLGNLISEENDEPEEVRNTVYCSTLAKKYGLKVLKGRNEDLCKKFPHPGFVEEFSLLKESFDENGLAFLSRLPIRQSDEELNRLEAKITQKHGHPDLNLLTGQELEGYCGKIIARNLDFLFSRNPRTTAFFTGNRTECALWKPGLGAAHPQAIYDILGEKEGDHSLDVLQGSLVSPGSALEGHYCTFNIRNKKITLHSI